MGYRIEVLRNDVDNIRSTVSAANTSISLDASRAVIMRADGSVMSVECLLSDVDDISNRLTALEGMMQLLSHELKMLKEVPGFVVP